MNSLRFEPECDSINPMGIKRLFPVILFSVLFLVTGCRLVIGTSDALEIVVKGNQFTLAWDPGGPVIPNNPGRVAAYNVYYRDHGSYYWRYLATIEDPNNPECLITDKDIDYGVYDFAVSAVGADGGVSAFHSSLDRTADPICGWYINWIGTK